MRILFRSSNLALLLILILFTAALAGSGSIALAQDCNQNGIPDIQDIDPLDPDGDGQVSEDCNADGEPDECDVQTSRLLGATATHLVEIDRLNYSVTEVMPLPGDIDCMAYHAGLGLLFVSDNDNLWSINLDTQTSNLVGNFFLIENRPRFLMYDSVRNRLLGVSSSRLFEIDPTDASTSTILNFQCCNIFPYVYYPVTDQLVNSQSGPWRLLSAETGLFEAELSFDGYQPGTTDMVFDAVGNHFWSLRATTDYSILRRDTVEDLSIVRSRLEVALVDEDPLFALAMIDLSPAQAATTDADCNTNSIPDSCEIAACIDNASGCSDCDGNGQLDICDRIDGTYQGPIRVPEDDPNHRAHTVALDGDYLAVYWSRTTLPNQFDYVRIYRRVNDDWEFQQQIENGTTTSFRFEDISRPIDMDRGRLAVINPGNSSFVDIYTRDAGGQYILSQSIPINTGIMQFGGCCVDLDGSLLAVGIAETFLGGIFSGSVIVGRESLGTWGVEAIIESPDNGEDFGQAVAIENDTLLIGDHSLSLGSTNPKGRCYVYRHNGVNWNLAQQFDGVEPGDRFGTSVAIYDGFAAVGASGCSGYFFCNLGLPGYVQMLELDEATDEWMMTQRLEGPTPIAGLTFGWSVDLGRNQLAVGAPSFFSNSIPRMPSVHVFERGNGQWMPVTTARAGNGNLPIMYGRSVTIDGGRVATVDGLSSVPLSNERPRGHVFSYPSDLNDNGVFDLCEINAGATDSDGDLLPDAFDSDCDGDGMADRDSLVDNDCNRNGVPDHCELDPTDPDGDGITLDDCNGDQIPDGCQLNRYIEFDELIVSRLPPGPQPGARIAASADWAVHYLFIDTLGDIVGSGQPFVAVFQRVGSRWEFFQVLGAADALVQDSFGLAADVDRDSIVVVGSSSDGPIMNFYRFDGSLWQLEAEVPIPATETPSAQVMLLADTAVVGLPGEDLADGSEGVAFVFKRENDIWAMDERLDGPASMAPYDWFGLDVEINGDEILVSSGDNFVTVFQRNASTWQTSQVITPPPGFTVNNFGMSITAERRRLVIGSLSFSTPSGSSNKGVFYYRKQGNHWGLAQIILDSGNPNEFTAFGGVVDLNGGLLAVSARNRRSELGLGTLAGSVSLFQLNPSSNQFSFMELVRPFPDVSFRSFGRSMALSGAQILAGHDGFEFASPYERSVTAVGGARDADGNGVMDECELDGNDCNGNGILDRVEPDYTSLDDFLDVLLSDAGASSPCQFDTNGDGAINGGDIAGFVSRLTI